VLLAGLLIRFKLQHGNVLAIVFKSGLDGGADLMQ
jgi:hypothetical protein